MDGVLIVAKEKGYTSFDAVARLRGIFGQKKIGHLGTLDPEAEGVLPVLLGRATKLADLLSEGTKVYRTVLYLGAETDTQDACGKVFAHHLVTSTMRHVILREHLLHRLAALYALGIGDGVDTVAVGIKAHASDDILNARNKGVEIVCGKERQAVWN